MKDLISSSLQLLRQLLERRLGEGDVVLDGPETLAHTLGHGGLLRLPLDDRPAILALPLRPLLGGLLLFGAVLGGLHVARGIGRGCGVALGVGVAVECRGVGGVAQVGVLAPEGTGDRVVPAGPQVLEAGGARGLLAVVAIVGKLGLVAETA